MPSTPSEPKQQRRRRAADRNLETEVSRDAAQPPAPAPPGEFHFEAWPTEFQVVTQKFNVNPDNYKRFGLPGHEGIDIKAPTGSKVFCVASGQVKLVTLVGADPKQPAYGNHVRVLHVNGYETIYGHMQSVAVAIGQTVAAGQILGIADNTGNSTGAHLHLTLKHQGETFDGFPSSIIDPTPFLMPLLGKPAVVVAAPTVIVCEKLGLNCNAPTDENGNISPRVADPGLIASTGVGWVRLNFILRPFNSPTEGGWIDNYRKIIAGLRGQNLRIYGLIHAQAVAGDPGNQFRDQPGASLDNDWINNYAQNFRTIVQQFHDDVEVFESFNEPNDWHRVPGDKPWEQAWIHPYWFAVILQKVYESVRDLNVKLVSGPLLSTQFGNAAADYLPKVYEAGKKFFNWGSGSVPVPFDGVGFHPYVLMDSNNPASEIPPRYQQYMQGVRDAIAGGENGAMRPIYVSEIGFQNAEERQVECMKVALRCALDDPAVALCFWYGMQDDPAESYGLYRKDGLTPDQQKPAYKAFVALAHENRQVPVAIARPAPLVSNAKFVAELDKVRDGTVMAPGAAFTKIWRMQNTGTTSWGDGYRLLRVDGNSLGAPASIPVPACPPGTSVDLSVPFAAPPDASSYTSTWQLVDPQGRRFGQKVWTTIKVQVPVAPAAAPRELPFGPTPFQAPAPAELGFGQPALSAALGIIYTTYWLRVQAALSSADPQQALLEVSNDALGQIKEWTGQ